MSKRFEPTASRTMLSDSDETALLDFSTTVPCKLLYPTPSAHTRLGP